METISSSFRDPSGFVFTREGRVFRQVNAGYREDYDLLLSSGLYAELSGGGMMVAHREAPLENSPDGAAYKVLEPERVPFVSYPYEWCFSQLQDAATLTLRIQKTALRYGMSLKDASAYNIQFAQGKPVLIDTLSFERRKRGQPWVAYRQFCQHFLAPLALAARTDARLQQLLRVHLDGIPLDLASALLPASTWWRPTLLSHIHLHAKAQRHFSGRPAPAAKRPVSETGLAGILDNLEAAVRALRWEPRGTVWADYYADTNYSAAAFEQKKSVVGEMLDAVRPASVWDVGGNVGVFARLATQRGIPTVCFDADAAAVEKNYRECVAQAETILLPLVLDLTNPSPGLGWAHAERASLAQRGPAGMVLALALVHHLAIANNVPLPRVAEFFARVGVTLVVEFVPKSDSQTQRLLASREDIFSEYTREEFERAFMKYFRIERCVALRDSERAIYLMRRGATA